MIESLRGVFILCTFFKVRTNRIHWKIRNVL